MFIQLLQCLLPLESQFRVGKLSGGCSAAAEQLLSGEQRSEPALAAVAGVF